MSPPRVPQGWASCMNSQPVQKQEWGRVLGLGIKPGSTHLSAWGPPFSWIPPTALLAPQPLEPRQKRV